MYNRTGTLGKYSRVTQGVMDPLNGKKGLGMPPPPPPTNFLPPTTTLWTEYCLPQLLFTPSPLPPFSPSHGAHAAVSKRLP